MNTETENLLAVVRDRRSHPIQNVSPDAIDLDDVKVMLEAARWAPTHGMTEPWRFGVFAGEARRALGEKFAVAYRAITPPEKFDVKGEQTQRERPLAAPVWVSLAMFRSATPKMPEWEDLASVAIAAQHIHLVAHSMGYACKWTSGDIVRHDCVLQHTGLSAPSKLLGFLYIGRPIGLAQPGRRTPVENFTTWF